jgi:hypothetical protein
MHGPTQPSDEALEQSINDCSLIDHLIQTFHTGGGDHQPMQERPAAIHDQIRREWPG